MTQVVTSLQKLRAQPGLKNRVHFCLTSVVISFSKFQKKRLIPVPLGKIDEDTWSQISERMLLKNAEKVTTWIPESRHFWVILFDSVRDFSKSGPTPS